MVGMFAPRNAAIRMTGPDQSVLTPLAPCSTGLIVTQNWLDCGKASRASQPELDANREHLEGLHLWA
jgi:hypothetical protein